MDPLTGGEGAQTHLDGRAEGDEDRQEDVRNKEFHYKKAVIRSQHADSARGWITPLHAKKSWTQKAMIAWRDSEHLEDFPVLVR